MGRDVREAEVVPGERGEEDDRGEEHAHERGEERVRRRFEQPAAPTVGRVAPRNPRVDNEAERDDERGAPQPGHQ
jgi:hypothetical protein